MCLQFEMSGTLQEDAVQLPNKVLTGHSLQL